jgi:hypothetical protein
MFGAEFVGVRAMVDGPDFRAIWLFGERTLLAEFLWFRSDPGPPPLTGDR